MFSLSPAQSNPFIATNRPHHTHFYTPVTPSPLRTSRNANLMPASPGNAGNGNSSPIIASSPLGKFAVRDEQEQDENVIPGAFFGGSMNRNDGSTREEGNSGVQKTQSGISSRHTSPTGGAAGMQKTPETLKQYYPSMNGCAGENGSALVTPPDSTSSNSASNANLSGRVSGSITQSGFCVWQRTGDSDSELGIVHLHWWTGREKGRQRLGISCSRCESGCGNSTTRSSGTRDEEISIP